MKDQLHELIEELEDRLAVVYAALEPPEMKSAVGEDQIRRRLASMN